MHLFDMDYLVVLSYGLVFYGVCCILYNSKKRQQKLLLLLQRCVSDAVDISLSTDWGPKIDVVGFCFLDLASSYIPQYSLVKWLEDGKKPIYIGFGSLVSF